MKKIASRLSLVWWSGVRMAAVLLAVAGTAFSETPERTSESGVSAGFTYDPSRTRDPFKTVSPETRPEGKQIKEPLERFSITDLSLTGIVWDGTNYTAMVQTPEGEGYTVRAGMRVGPNKGVIRAITKNTLVVHEPYIDLDKQQQVREYVKHLHVPEDGK